MNAEVPCHWFPGRSAHRSSEGRRSASQSCQTFRVAASAFPELPDIPGGRLDPGAHKVGRAAGRFNSRVKISDHCKRLSSPSRGAQPESTRSRLGSSFSVPSKCRRAPAAHYLVAVFLRKSASALTESSAGHLVKTAPMSGSPQGVFADVQPFGAAISLVATLLALRVTASFHPSFCASASAACSARGLGSTLQRTKPHRRRT
jgi:hypothetical protein